MASHLSMQWRLDRGIQTGDCPRALLDYKRCLGKLVGLGVSFERSDELLSTTLEVQHGRKEK